MRTEEQRKNVENTQRVVTGQILELLREWEEKDLDSGMAMVSSLSVLMTSLLITATSRSGLALICSAVFKDMAFRLKQFEKSIEEEEGKDG